MATVKRTPTIEIKLNQADFVRLEQICMSKKKTKTDVVRAATSWYLDNLDKLENEERESPVEKRIRKMEERIAALQARIAIDIGMIYHLIYRNMDTETRDDIIAWAYNNSVNRLKKKLVGKSAEVKELMQKKDDQVSCQA